MIIEDDPDIRAIMRDHFEPLYHVITAENGKEAIAKLETMSSKPCIVFLDLMMPVMNGWEFLEYVEKEGLLPGVEIVITTAAHPDKVPKHISFLLKPFSIYSIEDYCKNSCIIKPGGDSSAHEP